MFFEEEIIAERKAQLKRRIDSLLRKGLIQIPDDLNILSPRLFMYFNLGLHEKQNPDLLWNLKDARTDLWGDNIFTIQQPSNCAKAILKKEQTLIEYQCSFENHNLQIEKYHSELYHALTTIGQVSSDTLNLVTSNLKEVYFLKAKTCFNFSAIDYHGALFMIAPPYCFNDRVWFIDSLIHESSHMNLNLILLNLEEYFIGDPFSLRLSSPFRKKSLKRGVYHVLHAVYVIVELVIFYDKYYDFYREGNIKIKYSIVGRLLLNLRLLEFGLKSLNQDKILTEKGVNLVDKFQSILKELSLKHKPIAKLYKLPKNNDGIISSLFSLEEFLALNEIPNKIKNI